MSHFSVVCNCWLIVAGALAYKTIFFIRTALWKLAPQRIYVEFLVDNYALKTKKYDCHRAIFTLSFSNTPGRVRFESGKPLPPIFTQHCTLNEQRASRCGVRCQVRRLPARSNPGGGTCGNVRNIIVY